MTAFINNFLRDPENTSHCLGEVFYCWDLYSNGQEKNSAKTSSSVPSILLSLFAAQQINLWQGICAEFVHGNSRVTGKGQGKIQCVSTFSEWIQRPWPRIVTPWPLTCFATFAKLSTVPQFPHVGIVRFCISNPMVSTKHFMRSHLSFDLQNFTQEFPQICWLPPSLQAVDFFIFFFSQQHPHFSSSVLLMSARNTTHLVLPAPVLQNPTF